MNLVDDDEHILFLGKRAYAFDELLRQRANAALALNRFHHNSRAAVAFRKLAHAVKIICFGVNKAGSKRTEVLVEAVLPRGGERCYRSAVEAVFERNYGRIALALVFQSPKAGGFYGTFVCFCARI